MDCLPKFLLTVAVIIPLFSHAAHLPPTFKICDENSLNTECLAPAVERAFHELKNGYSRLGLLPIDPMFVKRIFIPASGSSPVHFQQEYINCNVTGISDSKVLRTEVDYDNVHMLAHAVTQTISLQGTYDLNGRVLVLPIVGQGTVNLTFAGMDSIHSIDGEAIMKKGKKYWKFNKYKVTFEPKQVYFHFDNLFNGDKVLGENMNKFMNENWKEIFEEMKSAFEESFGLIFKELANRIFAKVPLNEIFPLSQ